MYRPFQIGARIRSTVDIWGDTAGEVYTVIGPYFRAAKVPVLGGWTSVRVRRPGNPRKTRYITPHNITLFEILESSSE